MEPCKVSIYQVSQATQGNMTPALNMPDTVFYATNLTFETRHGHLSAAVLGGDTTLLKL